jgi:hypothetical protein
LKSDGERIPSRVASEERGKGKSGDAKKSIVIISPKSGSTTKEETIVLTFVVPSIQDVSSILVTNNDKVARQGKPLLDQAMKSGGEVNAIVPLELGKNLIEVVLVDKAGNKQSELVEIQRSRSRV